MENLQRLVLVDQWQKQSGAYFLTHMHVDHMKGLGSTWCRGPLYCSYVTSCLLLVRFPGLSKTLLCPLEVGVATMVEVWSDKKPELMEVTPIDAHHCPGSVMFLFRGSFGTRLHTGDFRWDAFLPTPTCPPSPKAASQVEPEELGTEPSSGLQQLREALRGRPVDLLVLDNTYCHPKYCFPKREEALEQIWAILQANPRHQILIGVDSLGKEDLLVTLATRLQTKIAVSPERWAIAKLLGLPDVFTILPHVPVSKSEEQPRISAVPRKSVNLDHLRVLNARAPTIGIVPSGWGYLDAPVNAFGAKQTCESESKYCTEGAASTGGREGELGEKSAERNALKGSAKEAKGSSSSVPQSSHQLSSPPSLTSKLLQSKATRGAAALAAKRAPAKPQEPQLSKEPLLFRIPYSLHSCFAELEAFVHFVKPSVIRPIAQKDPYGLDTCPNEHFGGLCERWAQGRSNWRIQRGLGCQKEVKISADVSKTQEVVKNNELSVEACEVRLMRKTKRAKPRRLCRAVRKFKRLRVGSASPPEKKEAESVGAEPICGKEAQLKGLQAQACCSFTSLLESASSLQLAAANEARQIQDGQFACESLELGVRSLCSAAVCVDLLEAAVPTACQVASNSSKQLESHVCQITAGGSCVGIEDCRVVSTTEKARFEQRSSTAKVLLEAVDSSGPAVFGGNDKRNSIKAAGGLPDWYLEAYRRWAVG